MTKLTKAQSKRFDEKFVDKKLPQYWKEPFDPENIKQHLASELAVQKKEIIEKLEKMKVPRSEIDLYSEWEGHTRALDQAIETIK